MRVAEAAVQAEEASGRRLLPHGAALQPAPVRPHHASTSGCLQHDTRRVSRREIVQRYYKYRRALFFSRASYFSSLLGF